MTLPAPPYFLAGDGVEAPLTPDLGDLQPTGKINPDGTQVYDYPPGSGLEGIIEVHVGPEGQVVREKVLRPETAPDAMIAEELADHQELCRQS